jgi:hypothetical protein
MHDEANLKNHLCSMPEHGRADAASACCRPAAPARVRPSRAKQSAFDPAFWRDRQTWQVAARNTLNCLLGCMIGDISMIVYLQAYHPQLPMMMTMGLAMVAGLITSILFEGAMLRWREGFSWLAAFRLAFSMSFLSMIGMELAANTTDFMLTGGRVPLSDPFYWVALTISIAAGFLAPLPYNYWKFKQHGKSCH